MQRSFSEVILVLISYIFLIIGFLHLFFTKHVAEFVVNISDQELTSLLQQFLGVAYMLIGVLLYINKKQKGMPLYAIIGSINIVSLIHLYLILLFHKMMALPYIYFIFIIIMQVALLIALVEQFRKRRIESSQVKY